MARGLAAVLVGVAWSALGYGLFLSPSNQRAWDDLDAGGRFGANLAVYLPYLALAIPVTIVVLLGLLPRPAALSPLGCAAAGVAVFAAWVATQDYLFDPQPQLVASVVCCFVADVAAGAALLTAWGLGVLVAGAGGATGDRRAGV
ncbi:hypothetical protein [Cryptosporangium phraense]|uniref:hypothetical protein n=1 Tax=Cryptosporangium phraense TaxID=2593070 RepID=UPI00197AB530|nr:hypothetical protein [Cryptosporangium phraense]